ncbi:GDSL-type esterase/lipase family protein [Sphingomonas fuzhouensis]|uniref:GDSL-type esterase/lipase family protein n=1 Tax=Sphingomonas fuzhouensis TaxID=3106033 RepID=UPI002AFE7140|nr:GDSL-type esterase/lipase family protein [Sphingomonas sp. SGZ-02]
MRSNGWRIAAILLALYAVALTLVNGIWIAKRGGISYIEEQLGLRQPHQIYNRHQTGRVRQFALYPKMAGGIVFAGDSITEGMPWAEYFEGAHNRGIAGDTSIGLRNRIVSAVAAQPDHIVINIGTNDLAHDRDVDAVRDTIWDIVAMAHRTAPKARLDIVSILPVSTRFDTSQLQARKKQAIPTLNAMLAQGAAAHGYRFLNVYPAMVDASGDLRRDYTVDGTHLTMLGKDRYARALRQAMGM